MSGPAPGNGVEFSGYGASVKAYGRNVILLFGFLVMAGAIVYDGWQERAAKTSQTELLASLLANQKTFIEGYVHAASSDHAEMRALCLGQALDRAREGARDLQNMKRGGR